MDVEDTTDAAGEGLQVADLLVEDSTGAGLMAEEGSEAEADSVVAVDLRAAEAADFVVTPAVDSMVVEEADSMAVEDFKAVEATAEGTGKRFRRQISLN